MLVLLVLPAFAGVGPRCHTPEHLLLRDVNAVAPPSPDPYRPDDVGYVDSTVYPLRIHYRRSEDADRAASVVLPVAETCWRIEIDQMGWPTPPADSGLGGDDKYDMYLTNEQTYGGAYTYGTGNDTNPDDNWYSLASYIALDDRGIVDEDMPDFICHEFNHALQYTIDGWELTLFPWESTAEAMEELTYPDTDLYQLDVPDFQSLPFASILFDGYSDEIMEYDDYSYYEYGGSIVGLYLEQRFGRSDGTKLLEMWDDMAQPSSTNEPDYVDALDVIGGTDAPDHGAFYLGLAEWRMFAGPLDDGAHYTEGGEWGRDGEVATEASVDITTADGATLTPVDPPYDLGTSYWPVNVGDGTDKALRITVTSPDDVEWGIVGAAWLGEGVPARTVNARSGADGASVTVDLDLTGATRGMFGVSSLGPQVMDAEGRHPRRSPTVTLALVEPGADTGGDDTAADSGGDNGAGNGGDGNGGGTGDTASGGDKGGCGCTTDSSGSAAWAGLALAAALVTRRRRG